MPAPSNKKKSSKPKPVGNYPAIPQTAEPSSSTTLPNEAKPAFNFTFFIENVTTTNLFDFLETASSIHEGQNLMQLFVHAFNEEKRVGYLEREETERMEAHRIGLCMSVQAHKLKLMHSAVLLDSAGTQMDPIPTTNIDIQTTPITPTLVNSNTQMACVVTNTADFSTQMMPTITLHNTTSSQTAVLAAKNPPHHFLNFPHLPPPITTSSFQPTSC